MQSAVHHLSSLKADPAVFGERGLPAGVRIKKDAFWDYYDNDTLFYDAICDTGQIRLYLPKALNFGKPLKRAMWQVDGKAVRPNRHKKYRVYETITLPFGTELKLVLDQSAFEIPLSPAEPERYAGRRVLYTQIKDDPLHWVHDWVVAHQRNHGVDAVLVANNNSTTYDSATLRDMLASIDNLAVGDVLDVPLRYGPLPNMAQGNGLTTFQQTLLLNLVRDRWLKNAAGVLVCDVDELVAARDGQSIFDVTARSWTKYTRFAGVWRYHQADDGAQRHVDHVYRKTPEAQCASKYCVVPDSFLGRGSWSVHALENVNRRLFPASRQFVHYHCRGITTAWKLARKTPDDLSLVKDPKTTEFMERSFPKLLPE